MTMVDDESAVVRTVALSVPGVTTVYDEGPIGSVIRGVGELAATVGGGVGLIETDRDRMLRVIIGIDGSRPAREVAAGVYRELVATYRGRGEPLPVFQVTVSTIGPV